MKKVGYWYSDREPSLPMPEGGGESDPLLINYLENGEALVAYKGSSMCRICHRLNGSKDLTDGTYVWPEGLAHYVREHGTPLPDDFLDWVRGEIPEQP